jgi:hypothetical protein
MWEKFFTLIFILFLLFFSNNNSIAQTNGSNILEMKNKDYIISNKNLILSVNRAGGRITSFKFNGFEFLTDKAINDFNYGSTFWSSPQSAWKNVLHLFCVNLIDFHAGKITLDLGIFVNKKFI